MLLIDDNEEIREAVSYYLISRGSECGVIADGYDGLVAIRNNDGDFYNVILLDLAIPEFSGFKIFEKIKEEGLLKSNNVILFTASM